MTTLTRDNIRQLDKIIKALIKQAPKNWGAKTKLESFWGECSDNDPREGMNSGEAPYGEV